MPLELSLPDEIDDLKPNITVIGVGGAGGNAVNNMIRSELTGVDFMAANTDSQALRVSQADHKIQLGLNITHGLGAGSRPDIGRAAAEEVLDEIMAHLEGTHMVFITAGMGGGTGTGAAPVIARAAREHGILTVGVVTKPFHFEGRHRMKTAEEGIEDLASYVDTLIVIPNQNLFRIANDKTTFAEAFHLADDVLHSGVRGVTDLMVKPGLINLDFADIRAVMGEMGKAMMGTGEASGERRAVEAAEAAISNPLLDDASMKGARGVLINITGGADMTLFEVDEAANRIRDEVDPEANIIFGATFDEKVEGVVRVSVVATGIDGSVAAKTRHERESAQAKAPTPEPEVEQADAEEELTSAHATSDEADNAPVAASDSPAAAVDEEPIPAETESEPAALEAVEDEPAEPQQRRWSLFGGDRQRSKPVKKQPQQTFVAPQPVRPPEDIEAVPAQTEMAIEASPKADSATESHGATRQGFASLFSRKQPTPDSLPQRRMPEDDGTVTLLPKAPTEEKPAPVAASAGQSDDMLEIPAFLRRQAR